MQQKKKNRDPIICICNNVPKSRIEAAIRRGCHSLAKIYDSTTAGVGPCGGSCRPSLQRMLNSFLKKGSFPQDPRK